MKNTSIKSIKATVYERPGPVSDMFVPHQVTVSLPIHKRIYRSPIAVLALLAVIALPVLLSGGGTGAYFSDHEESTGNTFAAGPLDFAVSSIPTDATLLLDQAGENFTLTVSPVPGSLPFRYKVSAAASGNPAFCAAITAVGAGPLVYSGPAASLVTSDTSSLTPWSLTLSLPLPATGVVDGQLCNLDLFFEGYQEGGAVGTEYHDTEHVILNLVAGQQVIVQQRVVGPTPDVISEVTEPTPTPSPTPEPVVTPTPTPEPTIIPTPTPEVTPEPTSTPTPSPEPTITPTPTPEPTVIPTPTPEPTPEPSLDTPA